MRLHIFKPAGWKATERRPAFIHFFGGGFVRGVPTQSAGWAKQAAKLGLVGIAADYRVLTRHGTDGTACIARCPCRLALAAGSCGGTRD